MSIFINELTAALAEDPLLPRLLLAPSERVGRQWLDRVAAGGGMAVNIRPSTMARLIRDFAGDGMTAAGLRHPTEADRLGIVRELFGDPGGWAAGYFSALEPTLAVLRLLDNALGDLGRAGIVDAAAVGKSVSPANKGRELARLYALFRSRLAAAGFADPPASAAHAVAELDRRAADADLPRLIIPRDFHDNLSGLERAFWQRWPEGKKRVLPVDESVRAEVSVFAADNGLDEAREIFRLLAAAEIPLDQAEVVAVNPAVSRALRTAATEVFAAPDGAPPRIEDLPLTFADGLPTGGSRPERALAAWLDWLDSEQSPAGLAGIAGSGLLDRAKLDKVGVSAERLAAYFLALPSPSGAAAISRAVSTHAGGDHGAAAAARQLADSLLWPLLDRPGPAGMLAATRALLADWTENRGELDSYARLRILEDPFLSGAARPWDGFPVGEWLRALLAEARIMGKGPQPGRLHISGPGGGHSGRRCLFVMGLDDASFPGGNRQDPVLLDAERQRLSGEMRLASERRKRREKELDLLLARATERVSLSFARRDADTGREQFPAAALSALARARSPDDGGDGFPTAVLVPDSPLKSLTARDYWLRRQLASGLPKTPLDMLGAFFPRLAAGERARRLRESDDFTVYDGLVPAYGERYRAERPTIAVTQLEAFTACPMHFFFRNVLGLRPPERHRPEAGYWLEPNERGSLLHQVFRGFLEGLRERNERADAARHRETIDRLLDAAVTEWARRTPPGDRLVFEREKRFLRESGRIFLHDEAELQKNARPLYLETSFGMGETVGRLPWNGGEAFCLDLPGGGRLLLSGMLDRVDRLDAGGLAVWDYKTGRADRYDARTPFAPGRIQAAVYAVVLAAMPGNVEPVAASGYYFPTPRESGRRVSHGYPELSPVLELLDAAAARLEAGAFLFLAAPDFAPYDYEPLYTAVGGIAKLRQQAERKVFSEGS